MAASIHLDSGMSSCLFDIDDAAVAAIKVSVWVGGGGGADPQWLGITFSLSMTRVNFLKLVSIIICIYISGIL